MKIPASLVLALACVTTICILSDSAMAEPRLNQIQLKGTHNSYHQQSAIAFHNSHKYTHLSLKDQLEKQGIRAFELDVHQSVLGGGLAVYHIGIVDGKTTCSKFKGCLKQLKEWSDLNPEHVTLFVWIEIKDDTGGPKFTHFDKVDSEIREVLGDRLLTPDTLQGDYPSLQAAIHTEGWPLVEEARGKFLFMLDHDDRTREVYLRGDSLKDRVMFPRAKEENLDEGWAVVAKAAPGPFHAAARDRNFLISDNICMAGDSASDCFAKLERATAAGTHLLMDDFEGGDKKQKNQDYFVHFDHGFHASCNPYSRLLECDSSAIDGY